MTGVVAAAGIAEAAWAMAACEIFLVMGVVAGVALFATAFRSRPLAGVAAGLLLLATLFYEPWRCFSPFEEAAYADPDVQSAAGMFRTVGIAWVVGCVAVGGSLLAAVLFPRRVSPTVATPDGLEGAPNTPP